MYNTTTTLLLALAALSTAAPQNKQEHIIEKRHIILENRSPEPQGGVPELLQLASQAGITALPTNPTLLLSLGPLAQSLAAALPTPSVLSILETAAPSNFVSDIINNPSYASSFEQAFSAGSSPSWFNALPTEVRSYLHTYSGFGVLAGAAGGVEKVESATQTGSQNGTGSATGTMTGTGAGLTNSAGSTTGSVASESTSSGMGAAESSSAAMASSESTAVTDVTSSAAGGASSASSQGGAAVVTGGVVGGVLGVVGMVGAVALL